MTDDNLKLSSSVENPLELKLREPERKESTLEASFAPTPHMEKWLDTAVKAETEEIKAIAEACGLDRSNWYKWLNQPGFIEWFEAEWNRKLLGNGWKLDLIGLKNAKRDHRYWESMQKRMGRLQDVHPVLIQNKFNDSDQMTIEIE